MNVTLTLRSALGAQLNALREQCKKAIQETYNAPHDENAKLYACIVVNMTFKERMRLAWALYYLEKRLQRAS